MKDGRRKTEDGKGDCTVVEDGKGDCTVVDDRKEDRT